MCKEHHRPVSGGIIFDFKGKRNVRRAVSNQWGRALVTKRAPGYVPVQPPSVRINANNIASASHPHQRGAFMTTIASSTSIADTVQSLIDEYGNGKLDELVPKLARDTRAMRRIESVVHGIETNHELILGDARSASSLEPDSVHLVVTSPPYWTLKRYNDLDEQMGHIEDYDAFIAGLDEVWSNCFRALIPGGRLVINVGDVCLSRRKNNGRHTVVPLHATIQDHCKAIGFDNLAPIIWHKIANANYEVSGGGGFLGKPYEPNAVIKNDIEFVLMQRKPGGYRSPTKAERLLSIISAENHQIWFRQIWMDLRGTSHPRHPAPYPVEFAERLIRMFSFVGDTVLDPFAGTGTTNLACAKWGRNSIGIELDPKYFDIAHKRLLSNSENFFTSVNVVTRTA